jgi:hypothetical protein
MLLAPVRVEQCSALVRFSIANVEAYTHKLAAVTVYTEVPSSGKSSSNSFTKHNTIIKELHFN